MSEKPSPNISTEAELNKIATGHSSAIMSKGRHENQTPLFRFYFIDNDVSD